MVELVVNVPNKAFRFTEGGPLVAIVAHSYVAVMGTIRVRHSSSKQYHSGAHAPLRELALTKSKKNIILNAQSLART